MTPRTIAVAVLTPVAVIASGYAAAVIVGLLVTGCPCPDYTGYSTFAHALWHLLWGVLTVAIALGLRRFRRAWPATGLTERDPTLRLHSSPRGSTAPAPNLLLAVRNFGLNQYRLLAGAQWLALASAAGQFLASAGANFLEGNFRIVHFVGELLAEGSLVILLLVCLLMLGLGVRGALRPIAQPL